MRIYLKSEEKARGKNLSPDLRYGSAEASGVNPSFFAH
jgi:hypothetical protein